MKWSYLPNRNGIEIDCDITKLDTADYAQLRELLFEHLIVVFRNQQPSSYEFSRMCHHIGYGRSGPASQNSISSWGYLNWHSDGSERFPDTVGLPRWRQVTAQGYPWPEQYIERKQDYPVQRVTGKPNHNDQPTGIFAQADLNWHSDLNAYNSSDGVGLQGWENCEGTTTEFLNTARCRQSWSNQTVQQLKSVYFNWMENHSNWSGTIEFVKQQKGIQSQSIQYGGFTGRYRLWLLQQNRAGTEGFYYHFLNDYTHNTTDQIQQMIHNSLFDDEFRYVHHWQPGDIVLMDQLLTLHQRGKISQADNNRRVLHRLEFVLSNYDNYLRRQNVIIPGRENNSYR